MLVVEDQASTRALMHPKRVLDAEKPFVVLDYNSPHRRFGEPAPPIYKALQSGLLVAVRPAYVRDNYRFRVEPHRIQELRLLSEIGTCLPGYLVQSSALSTTNCDGCRLRRTFKRLASRPSASSSRRHSLIWLWNCGISGWVP